MPIEYNMHASQSVLLDSLFNGYSIVGSDCESFPSVLLWKEHALFQHVLLRSLQMLKYLQQSYRKIQQLAWLQRFTLLSYNVHWSSFISTRFSHQKDPDCLLLSNISSIPRSMFHILQTKLQKVGTNKECFAHYFSSTIHISKILADSCLETTCKRN